MHFGIKNTLKNNHNHIFQRINMFEIVIINYNLNYFLFKNILKKLLKKKKRRKVANLHVCKWKCG
jgi:hypothetical protein